MASGKLYNGDCLSVMRTIPDNSVSSIVTDPPYGLKFMSKKWDYDVPSVEIWREALRVLKPGGTALIFAGSRTQHRMAVNIEDAGFVLKDCIMWIYGSGFPKSTDISKQLDKIAGADRKKIPIGDPVKRMIPGNDQNKTGSWLKENGKEFQPCQEIPSTKEAQLWNGYGTALKPAYEPIIVAMKPNDGTYANNALTHGVAGINIDGCRVGTDNKLSFGSRELGDGVKYGKCKPSTIGEQNTQGRFPANIIHDGSEEVLNLFPNSKSRSGGKAGEIGYHKGGKGAERGGHDDNGSAARFFYCAKASKKERGEGNNHPTVKPLALMEYLVRLVTPPDGGIILDPFMGSGTTGIACKKLQVSFIGIEKDTENDYYQIARDRIGAA